MSETCLCIVCYGKLFPNCDIWMIFQRTAGISINTDLRHFFLSTSLQVGTVAQHPATHLVLATVDNRLAAAMVMLWECTYGFKHVKLVGKECVIFQQLQGLWT